MAFSNEKLEPFLGLKQLMPKVFFMSVRSTTIRKSRKPRQCFVSLQKIKKGQQYISHSFRYEGRIMTISFDGCFYIYGHLNTNTEFKQQHLLTHPQKT